MDFAILYTVFGLITYFFIIVMREISAKRYVDDNVAFFAAVLWPLTLTIIFTSFALQFLRHLAMKIAHVIMRNF